MSVLDHIETNVQIWDGLSFQYVPETEAKKLQKEGTHQITTNLQSSELKTAAEFNEAREAREAKVKVKPAAKSKTKVMKAEDTALPGVAPGKTYKTREMKSE